MKRVVSIDGMVGGSPCIEGTRLTCANVAQRLRYESLDEYLGDYPHLDADDIRNCLEYCSRKHCIEDQVINFCEHCTLDTRPDVEPDAFVTDGELVPNPRSEGGRSHIYLGSPEDFANDRPEEIWLLAGELLGKLFPGAASKH